MPLFGSRLSRAQETEIDSTATSMMSLASVHTQAFDGMAAGLGKLNRDCQRAQRAGLGRLTIADGTTLDEARHHLEQQQSHIDRLHAEILRMPIRDWFPKKLKSSTLSGYRTWRLSGSGWKQL